MSLRSALARTLRSVPWLVHGAAGAFGRKALWEVPPPPEALESVRKILAIRLDAIGDFLMTTPALRALRSRWPAAELHVLVQPGVGAVARGLPWIDRAKTLPCNFLMRADGVGRGAGRWLSGARGLRRERYDLAVDFTGLFHSAAAARATGAPVRVGFRRKLVLGHFRAEGFSHFYTHEFPPAEGLHIAQEMNLLAAALGARADDGGWEMGRDPRARLEAERVLARAGIDPEEGPLVVVHPSAKWPPKRWPSTGFAETIDILQGRGWRAVVILGPGEKEILEGLRGACRTSPVFLWPPAPLETLGALLEKADVFVGNDSGPMHMAAAMGTPVVAIFGPTQPDRCRPKGSPFTAFYAALECSPCPLYFTRERCRRGHNYCMDGFRPSSVAAAVELAADRRKRQRRPSGLSSPAP